MIIIAVITISYALLAVYFSFKLANTEALLSNLLNDLVTRKPVISYVETTPPTQTAKRKARRAKRDATRLQGLIEAVEKTTSGPAANTIVVSQKRHGQLVDAGLAKPLKRPK